ncbi:MAG: hypothetical protein EGQ76_00100, partial [Sutterella sp.]|nr:hypothetical protein [Sutterella sp.]
GRPGRQGLKNLACYGKACTVSGNPALSSAGCLVMLIEAPQREVPLAGGRNLCVLSPAFFDSQSYR